MQSELSNENQLTSLPVDEPVALAKNAAVETDGSDWDEDTKMLAAILGTCLLVGGLMCCYCICLCIWCKAKRKSEANNWRRRQGDQDRTTDQTNVPIAISGLHVDQPETVAMTSFPSAPAPYEANPYSPTTYGGDYRNPCGGGPSPVLGRPSSSYKNVSTKESKSLILNERY